jgi:hypothetical protein
VFCKDAVSVNENAEKFARKVVNLWCDPELPEEYYVKQDEVLRRIDT